jgi:hypothetical protein
LKDGGKSSKNLRVNDLSWTLVKYERDGWPQGLERSFGLLFMTTKMASVFASVDADFGVITGERLQKNDATCVSVALEHVIQM